MGKKNDENDSCGLQCPKCRVGRCVKAFYHFNQSKHLCGHCQNSWW